MITFGWALNLRLKVREQVLPQMSLNAYFAAGLFGKLLPIEIHGLRANRCGKSIVLSTATTL